MEPASAAKILDEMEHQTASHILGLMPPDLSSQIINHLPVEKAKNLSLLLLHKIDLDQINHQNLKLIFNHP